MSISYAQFRDGVYVGGKHNSITSWSADKHGKEITAGLDGGFVVLTPEDGDERAVPMTNVIYLRRAPKMKPATEGKART